MIFIGDAAMIGKVFHELRRRATIPPSPYGAQSGIILILLPHRLLYHFPEPLLVAVERSEVCW